MKALLAACSLLLVTPTPGQVAGGSAGFGNQVEKSAAENIERAKRSDDKPSANSMFLDASVLINMKADQYVAVFGINEEGATLDEAKQKMERTVSAMVGELRALGLAPAATYVDFVSQNRIYGYEVVADTAKEKVVGFEVKKNVIVRYRDKSLLDKIVAAAAKHQVFDLVKVDYVVSDTAAIQNRLMAEAAKIIKRKAANHAKLLGIHLKPAPQVYAEKYSIHYPADMYDNYTAYEGEDVSGNYYRSRFIIQGARKARTFYFNALTGKQFDQVINPVVVEPVVQFTLYLKLRYQTSLGPKAN